MLLSFRGFRARAVPRPIRIAVPSLRLAFGWPRRSAPTLPDQREEFRRAFQSDLNGPSSARFVATAAERRNARILRRVRAALQDSARAA